MEGRRGTRTVCPLTPVSSFFHVIANMLAFLTLNKYIMPSISKGIEILL